MKLNRPAGILTALVTPFGRGGGIDHATVGQLVDYQVRSGVTGLVATAGAGEYVSLRLEERTETLRAVIKAAGGRVPVLAGILAPDTTSAVTAAAAAAAAGADGLLLLTPYYVAPSPGGLVEHFRAVAREAHLPIIVYNNPGRTGINVELPVLERLAEIDEIVGIKECDRDFGRVAQKFQRLGSRLSFLSGDDDLVLPFLSFGGPGAIMASTNLIAPLAVAILDAVRQHDWPKARQIFLERVLGFVALYKGPDHPGPLKQALRVAGLDVGPARPPLQPLEGERLRRLETGMKDLKLLDLPLIRATKTS